MNILCITDKQWREFGCHNQIRAIFEKNFSKMARAKIEMVYFHKDSNAFQENTPFCPIYILPYSTKHRNLLRALEQLNINLKAYDFIIIRNFYPVAKQILKAHNKVIFWETFPHDYRRIYEARLEKKAIFRKSIEYKIKFFLHQRILKQCKAYITMTPNLASLFQPNLSIPIFTLPGGIDFENLDQEAINKNLHHCNTPLKFIYTGTIDKNRQLQEILLGFLEAKGDFILDIFTASNNEAVQKIQSLVAQDKRISFHPPLPLLEMLKTLPHYDIGLGLIPNTPLYSVSSPFKTMEYAGSGLIPLINDLPEYLRLFDSTCAFFSDFDKESIKSTIETILNTPPETLENMKQAVFQRALENMDYSKLTQKLYEFLQSLLEEK
ncbi:glycosyltransferase family protein [Helicobacter mesocricetorum]|uniref:hypothetical protein n=1 Tax=Helicobacter mesocricetorum TaxID=87012 RepID=UPI000CF07D58|nr:hypothetical protein [Helicobacter mesocricetorum]